MWTYAKTDWQYGEYFDIANYNRIKENIEFLHTQGLLYFGKFSIIEIEDKTYDLYCFEEFFNDIEKNLQALKDKTLHFIDFEPTKQWIENGAVWTHEDINRIENMLLEMHTLIETMLQTFLRCGTVYTGARHFYLKN